MAKTATKPAAVSAAPALQITTIPLHELAQSPRNVRTTPPADIATLADSIAAQGLRQNLTVIPGGSREVPFEVIAGGRRLLALQKLAAEGRIPNDYAVACQIAQAGEATALSLTENQQREALHPVDEAEAFAELVNGKKKKLAEIAAEYGVTNRYVKQRLKLAGLAPEVLAAGRDGRLPLLALQAFTISDDHDRQRAVLAVLVEADKLDGSYDPEDIADEISGELCEEFMRADDSLVEFVGLDAYQAAGGELVNDLFSDDDAPTLLRDGALVRKLADKKLAKEAKKRAGEGWLAVVPESKHDAKSFRQVWPGRRPATEAEAAEQTALSAELDALNQLNETSSEQDQRHDDIQDRLQEIEDRQYEFPPDQRALVTLVLGITYGGNLEEEGFYVAADRWDEFNALRNSAAMKAAAEKREKETSTTTTGTDAGGNNSQETGEPGHETILFGVPTVRALYNKLIEVKDHIRDGKTGGGNRDYLLDEMQVILDQLAARLLEG